MGVLLSMSRGFVKLVSMADFCVFNSLKGLVLVGYYLYSVEEKVLRPLGEHRIEDCLGYIFNDDKEYY